MFKDDKLTVALCQQKLINGQCPNKDRHIWKYKTGQCSRGWCEGSNPKDWKGSPASTCKLWANCPCSCHLTYDQLFAAGGLAREVVNNSEYRVDKTIFSMPTPEERAAMHALSDTKRPDAPVLVESPLPDAVPATIRRTFTPTATGRAARGELESWVKDQCDIWLIEKDGSLCTPQLLADEIGRAQGIKPPSVGAISAVFDRWVKLDFAVIEKKPTRFIQYTEQGVKLGLDGCKEKAKRAKRLQQGAESRRIGGREK
jgi:hypothetical protein